MKSLAQTIYMFCFNDPTLHMIKKTNVPRLMEKMIAKAFKEIHRSLKPEGIAVIVFAHKSTDAWEAIINSLLKSGLVLTASWPIHTEMKARSYYGIGMP